MLCSVCGGTRSVLLQEFPLRWLTCPACRGHGVDNPIGPGTIPGSRMAKASVVQKMHERAGLPVPTVKQVLAARHQREDFF
jgi:hypothetical protein